jgi:hypothetical protein
MFRHACPHPKAALGLISRDLRSYEEMLACGADDAEDSEAVRFTPAGQRFLQYSRHDRPPASIAGVTRNV